MRNRQGVPVFQGRPRDVAIGRPIEQRRNEDSLPRDGIAAAEADRATSALLLRAGFGRLSGKAGTPESPGPNHLVLDDCVSSLNM